MVKKSNLIPAQGFSLTEDWKNLPLAVIDFETTGLDPKSDRIVEYAVSHFNKSEFEGSISGLLNPGFEIPEEATRVHGIKNEDVKDKLSFEQMYEHFTTILQGRIPVAYNAEFDREFLLNEASRVIRKIVVEQARKAETMMITPELIEQQLNPDNLPPAFKPNIEWIDPLVWARHIQKYEKGKKLTDVCRRLGIEIEAHRASADAEAAGRVLLALERRIDEKQYHLLISRQQELAFEQQMEFKRWRARQPK